MSADPPARNIQLPIIRPYHRQLASNLHMDEWYIIQLTAIAWANHYLDNDYWLYLSVEHQAFLFRDSFPKMGVLNLKKLAFITTLASVLLTVLIMILIILAMLSMDDGKYILLIVLK